MKVASAIVATGNRHKLREIISIARLINFDCELASSSNYPNAPKIVEDGATYEENARKKALATAKACNAPALAEDSGFEVKAIGGKPGLYSARFADEIAKKQGITDPAKVQEAANHEILRLLEGREFEEREARYVSVACMAFPDGRAFCGRGENAGRVADNERGTQGFGFDPIFLPKEYEYERTFSELGDEVKNTISHRRRAMEALQKNLQVL